jgi:outer membrane protein OmpA-like peptidoglycan-associated protein
MHFVLALLLAYTDPYAPDTEAAAEAAAEAAVARLGPNRAINIIPTILNIVGLQTGVVASVQSVQQAMRDLGAHETNVEIKVELPADVLFDFDKADIRPDAAAALAKLAVIIRANPKGRTRIEGHTDSKGDDAYNQKLSERRAESVKNWLVAKEGIDGARLMTKGWGETKPIAPNDTDANRQKNRRVEAIVEKG